MTPEWLQHPLAAEITVMNGPFAEFSLKERLRGFVEKIPMSTTGRCGVCHFPSTISKILPFPADVFGGDVATHGATAEGIRV